MNAWYYFTRYPEWSMAAMVLSTVVGVALLYLLQVLEDWLMDPVDGGRDHRP